MNSLGAARRLVFGISVDQTRVDRRGFRVHLPALEERLQEIGRAFVGGYHAALLESKPDALGAVLKRSVAMELEGFAFEGAAMGLALRDLLSPWKSMHLSRFLNEAGARHRYMVHVGAGWALARLHRRPDPFLAGFDPLLRWLVLDGYGFHQGYFHWPRYVDGTRTPRRLTGYARRAFDQGLGRSLWFVEGADARRIPERIRTFDPERRGDLWSGVGLAAAYAGGVDAACLQALIDAAGGFQPHLAQGAAFAARARELALNPVSHTELACQVFGGLSAVEAARYAEEALVGLAGSDQACRLSAKTTPNSLTKTMSGLPAESACGVPPYELWREKLRNRLSLVTLP
jgi:hypothetical protein